MLSTILEKSIAIRNGKHTPCGRPVVVPLAGFYRRSDEAERERARMYYNLATVFGFQNWNTATYAPTPLPCPGRDGQESDRQHYGNRAKATFRDNLSHPLEYLEGNKNHLNDAHKPGETDKEFEKACNAGVRRVRLARDYHETKLGMEISGLKSVDLERVSSTGFGPGSASDHAISCMQKVSKWEQAMPKAVRTTMSRTLYEGVFTFFPLKTQDSKHALMHLRVGLDIIAEVEGEISLSDLLNDWPQLQNWHPRKHEAVLHGWADR